MLKTQKPDDKANHELIKHWKGLKKRPRIIALDLDYTLWPFYVDCHVDPPFTRRRLNEDIEIIVDSNGFDLSGYKEVTTILHTLKNYCFDDDQHLAVASRSTTEDLAKKLIEELGWTEYFSSFQIYPRNKINHMKQIMEELKFDKYEEVLFFDDEVTNIHTTSSIGVVAIEIDHQTGFNMDILKHGLTHFENRSKKK